MEETGRLSRHFWMTQGMARAVGVNLNTALQDGRISRADYALAIAECCHCPYHQRCLDWLAVNGAGAERQPAFCAIGPMLDGLRESE
ncbi:MAG: DUF6455 family protein [Paracoccaceae bacterium]